MSVQLPSLPKRKTNLEQQFLIYIFELQIYISHACNTIYPELTHQSKTKLSKRNQNSSVFVRHILFIPEYIMRALDMYARTYAEANINIVTCLYR